jgi:hypothetical protein
MFNSTIRNELDAGTLMWFIHRHFRATDLPTQRMVMQLEFTDVRRMKRWWLVLENGSRLKPFNSAAERFVS